jgi:anthranilate synthase component 1
VCYFSYDGNVDSCIAIRTSVIKDGMIYVQSGAGLVADSKPEAEYQETINKASGMLKAIELASRLDVS